MLKEFRSWKDLSVEADMDEVYRPLIKECKKEVSTAEQEQLKTLLSSLLSSWEQLYYGKTLRTAEDLKKYLIYRDGGVQVLTDCSTLYPVNDFYIHRIYYNKNNVIMVELYNTPADEDPIVVPFHLIQF